MPHDPNAHTKARFKNERMLRLVDRLRSGERIRIHPKHWNRFLDAYEERCGSGSVDWRCEFKPGQVFITEMKS